MVKTWRRTVLLLFIAAILTAPAYLRAYVLTGVSDAPTLLLGDKALVNKAAYSVNLPYSNIKIAQAGQPKRGDMVQIKWPEHPVLLFKRVIGLPGETIELRDHRVLIDGTRLPLNPISSDVSWVPPAHHLGSTIFDEDGHRIAFTPGAGENRDMRPVHLAGDQYFLMGDNRDVSLDCRVWGPLKKEAILGKVILTMATGPRLRPGRLP